VDCFSKKSWKVKEILILKLKNLYQQKIPERVFFVDKFLTQFCRKLTTGYNSTMEQNLNEVLDTAVNSDNRFKNNYSSIILSSIIVIIAIPKIYLPLIYEFSLNKLLLALIPPLVVFFLFKSKHSFLFKIIVIIISLLIVFSIAALVFYYLDFNKSA